MAYEFYLNASSRPTYLRDSKLLFPTVDAFMWLTKKNFCKKVLNNWNVSVETLLKFNKVMILTELMAGYKHKKVNVKVKKLKSRKSI